MKKVLLFLFLIASMLVSTKTLVANSLSPPQSLDAKFVPQQTMLQITLSAETPQPNVTLFECDVSRSVWFENYQSVTPRRLSVPCALNFQVLVNHNSARTSIGKSDILLEAISPQCRAVITSDFSQSVITRNAVDLTEAISPNCRTVFSSCYLISSKTCLIAAISPACRDVLFIG